MSGEELGSETLLDDHGADARKASHVPLLDGDASAADACAEQDGAAVPGRDEHASEAEVDCVAAFAAEQQTEDPAAARGITLKRKASSIALERKKLYDAMSYQAKKLEGECLLQWNKIKQGSFAMKRRLADMFKEERALEGSLLRCKSFETQWHMKSGTHVLEE